MTGIKNRELLHWIPSQKNAKLTSRDMFMKCMDWLYAEVPDFRSLTETFLDYALCTRDENPLVNYADYARPEVTLQAGGSEGIYISWYWNDGDGSHIPIGTLKTLREDLDAYATCGRIAGLLQFVSEQFAWENYENIPSTKLGD